MHRSPADALAILLQGNGRFVANTPMHPNQDALQRVRSAGGQTPFAVVFGCSDSRVAAEIVFDQGLGDLFVVRTAGHLLGSEVTASIEFGIVALDVPLVVILGHDSCGAVGAAMDAYDSGSSPGGHLRTIVERLSPEVFQARSRGITDRDEVARLHVEATAERLLERSPAVKERVDDGRCAIVGLAYTLLDGRVHTVATRGKAIAGT